MANTPVEIWDGITAINGMSPSMIRKRFNINENDTMYIVRTGAKIVYFDKVAPDDEQLRRFESPITQVETPKPHRRRIDFLRDKRQKDRAARKEAKAKERASRNTQ